MRYRVVWLEDVLDELTSIWLNADATARKAITAAVHETDQRLAKSPITEGESRFGSERFLFVSPLTMTFHVDNSRLEAVIVSVGYYQKRKRK